MGIDCGLPDLNLETQVNQATCSYAVWLVWLLLLPLRPIKEKKRSINRVSDVFNMRDLHDIATVSVYGGMGYCFPFYGSKILDLAKEVPLKALMVQVTPSRGC